MILPLLILNENVKNVAHPTNITYNVDDKTNKKTNKTINYYNELSTIQQYNPLNDKNITGLTTKNGNWIKRKMMIINFQNKGKNFSNYQIGSIARQVPDTSTAYTDVNPADPFIAQTNYGSYYTVYDPQFDTTIEIGGNVWGLGGVDSAYHKMNIVIPWVDIQSWLNVNGKIINQSRIKNVYIIPEIELYNPPLNQVTIELDNVQINDIVHSYAIKKNMEIPSQFQNSVWTSSDVLGTALQILGYGTAIASFIPGTQLISLATSSISLISSVASDINKQVAGTDKSYLYTNNEKNRIKIPINLDLKYGKDLKIEIPKIKVTGERYFGAWADHTSARLSNIYITLELE